ncbi:4564_t:CDS:2, partial [Diversispora eburnea]
FLDECSTETFDKKIDDYLRCLDMISSSEKGKRKKKADSLLDRYKKAIEIVANFSNFLFKGTRVDHKLARKCDKERMNKQILLNQPAFTEIASGGNIYGGTINSGINLSKRNNEEEDNEVPAKQTKRKLRKTKSGRKIPDYCELSDKKENEIKSDIKESFDKEYGKMKDHLKWKLSCTGRVVEDILYECMSDFTSEHLIHSFTIDIDDPIIQGIFFPRELQEIEETNVKEDPDLSSKLYENLAQIRKIMKEIDHEEYNFEADTLKYSVHSLVRQYERTPNTFSLDHYEAWYNVNVWGPIIDRTFDNIPNVDIARGESASLASSDRKNRNRTMDTRKKMGRKGDAIIRKLSGGMKLEFGGSEAGKHYEGQGAT